MVFVSAESGPCGNVHTMVGQSEEDVMICDKKINVKNILVSKKREEEGEKTTKKL